MISEIQKAARRQYACSSDSAAICGVDPYRSAADIFLEKSGKVDGFEGNDATDRGNLLEPVVLDWAALQIGKFQCLYRDQMKVSACGALAANFDAIAEPMDGFIVEAKTTVNDDEWGEPGTNEIPERHIVQVHHAMYVAGPEYRLAYVPVLIPVYRKFDFRLYVVQRDDALADAVAERCREFMRHNVALGIPPADSWPSLEVLKRMRRQPNKSVDLPDDAVDRLIVARAARKQAKEDCKSAEAVVLTHLADAEAGNYSGGTLTYFEIQRKAYYVEASSYRSIKIKSHKEKQ